MTARVIVVGSVNVDLVATVDHLPAPGETVTGGRFAQHHGGKGGNQAVAAARLGAATSFVGAVGADDVRDGGAGGARSRGRGRDRAPDAPRSGDRRRADPRRRHGREQHRGRGRRQRRPRARARPRVARATRVRRPATSCSSGTRSRRDTATEALRIARAAGAIDGLQPGAGHGRRRPRRWRSPTSSPPTRARPPSSRARRRCPRRSVAELARPGRGRRPRPHHARASRGAARRSGRDRRRSRRRRSRSSTRSAPATRSTARSRPGWRPACPSTEAARRAVVGRLPGGHARGRARGDADRS